VRWEREKGKTLFPDKNNKNNEKRRKKMATEMKENVHWSTCRLCGHGYCDVNVYEVNGQVTKVLPNPNWPYSAAHCPKLQNDGRAALEYHYHPDRLNFPLKRVGARGQGEWQKVSWDQALDEVAARLMEIKKEFGPEALGAVTGTGRYPDYTWPKVRFLNLFGSPNNMGNEAICHASFTKPYDITAGWSAPLLSIPQGAKCIVSPSNTSESCPPMFAGLLDAKKAGTKIISVDSRFTDTSRIADVFLQVRPGTDGALYLAWLNIIIEEDLYDHDFVEKWTVGFDKLKEYVKEWTPEKAAEITGVEADKIRYAARMYAGKPSRILWSQSYEGQAPNGFRTWRTIAMLDAVTGNLDVGCPILGPYTADGFVDEYQIEGNDLVPESQWKKQIGAERFKVQSHIGWSLIGENQKKRWGTQSYTVWLNQAHPPTVWRQILSEKPYPVKALILTGCGALMKFSNPKLIYQAFKKLDLLVVADFFPNPNTMLADYVFPMADWMERDILEGYMAHLMGGLRGAPKAVPPMYERRSDYDFWRGLAIRCGQEKYWPWETLEEAYDYRLAPQGNTFRQFVEKVHNLPYPMDVRETRYDMTNPQTGQPYGFGTPSGKAEIYSSLLEEMGYDPLTHYEEPNFSPISTPEYAEEYPLILITGHRHLPFFHSELRQIHSLRTMHPDPIVEINPETAKKLDPPVADGDWVYIETHLGRVKMRARVTTGIDPTVVAAEHNWWFPEKAPEEPSLYGVWESNINVLLDDDPDKCGQEHGNYTCKNAMCKVYKA